jgi:hypothetical protein
LIVTASACVARRQDDRSSYLERDTLARLEFARDNAFAVHDRRHPARPRRHDTTVTDPPGRATRRKARLPGDGPDDATAPRLLVSCAGDDPADATGDGAGRPPARQAEGCRSRRFGCGSGIANRLGSAGRFGAPAGDRAQPESGDYGTLIATRRKKVAAVCWLLSCSSSFLLLRRRMRGGDGQF